MRFAPYTIGTELTAIPRRYDEEVYRSWRDNTANFVTSEVLPEALASVKKLMKARGLRAHCIDIDSHCIEVSSPKLSRFADYKNWSIAVRKVYKDSDCYPQHPDTVCGGAHLHVGNIPNELKIALAKDMIMRPYLPWVFGQPDECGAMDVLFDKKSWIHGLISSRLNRRPDQWPRDYTRGDIWALDVLMNDRHPMDAKYRQDLSYASWDLRTTFDPKVKKNKTPDIIKQMDWSKDFMFRMSGYGTVEFRFFEMAPVWEEQELQAKFALSYINWVRKRQEKGDETKVRLIDNKELQALKSVQVAGEFRGLCSEIGLDPAEYNVFIKRNLFPRWRDGRERR